MRALLLLLVILGLSLGLSPSSYLSSSDREQLKLVLEPAWSLSDIAQVLYASASYKYLKLEIPHLTSVCSFVKNSAKDEATVEVLFHASSAGKVLGCPVTVSTASKQVISDAIREGASPQELYYAVAAASNLDMQVDSAKVLRAVQQALKKDDSILSLGYAFHVGSKLKGDLAPIFDRIEDAVVQADEVDGRMLQFEGGLSITALVLTGAYRLAEAANRPIPVKPDQAVKFANYLVSRRSVQMSKGVYYLLEAISTFTSNKYHIPVAITLASNVAVSESVPQVQVRVTDLMGSSLPSLTVTADSAMHIKDKLEIVSNEVLKQVQDDDTLYELDIMSHKPTRGFYTLVVSAKGVDTHYVGHTAATLTFKVLTAVSIESVEIGTADADQTLAPNLKKVHFPARLDQILEVDYHQKLMLHFTLRHSSLGEATTVHQAFVRLANEHLRKEVILVAEPDSSGVYKFDMDVGSSAKEFGSQSGKYSVELIIGDASISNPILWHLADVTLTFSDSPSSEPSKDYTYMAKPEIKHVFRSPDQRPPSVVSNVFTVLCVIPLLILLVLWLKLGVNVAGFWLSPSTVGFHLGLGAIFGLFFIFWLQLDMFSTLRYLFFIGIFTFFCGNSMLSTMATNRKEQEVKMVYGPYYHQSYRFSS